jgi:hypothetical protein
LGWSVGNHQKIYFRNNQTEFWPSAEIRKKMKRRAFGESPIIALFISGVKEVKSLSISERSGEMDWSEAETLEF